MDQTGSSSAAKGPRVSASQAKPTRVGLGSLNLSHFSSCGSPKLGAQDVSNDLSSIIV